MAAKQRADAYVRAAGERQMWTAVSVDVVAVGRVPVALVAVRRGEDGRQRQRITSASRSLGDQEVRAPAQRLNRDIS